MAMSKRHMVTMKRSCSCSMPGVWRAVAHNEGAVVIYHSPKACGHVTRDMDLGGHYRSVARQEFRSEQYTAPLVVSGLQEQHSIFGGIEKLRQCIDYVVEKYKPLYIVIASSCVAGVIGDDTKAVACEAELAWGIPILAVPCGGFVDGDYHAGFYHTGRILAERMMSHQPKIDHTVALLGDHGSPQGPDRQEIEELLQYFGLRVHCQFPTYASVDEMKKIPAASFCVLLGGKYQSYSWMRKLAVDLQERYNIPFFDYDYPIGWQETKNWLANMGKFLHKEEEALLAEKEQEQRLMQQVELFSEKMQGKKIVLCIGRPLLHFHPAWVLEFISLSGLVLEGIILLKGLTQEQQTAMTQELRKSTTAVILDESTGDELLQCSNLVVTTHELRDDTKRQFFLPIIPPLGVGGTLLLMKKLLQLAERPQQRGGIIYG